MQPQRIILSSCDDNKQHGCNVCVFTTLVCGNLTSVVIFSNVAVVTVTVPDVNAKRLRLVVVERSKALVPSTPYRCLFRLIPTATLNVIYAVIYYFSIIK